MDCYSSEKLYGKKYICGYNTGSDIVSIFSENVDNNVQSDISVDTELSDNYLSEQAM